MNTLRRDLHIDGVWCPGSAGERFPVLDPADGSTVALGREGGSEGVLESLETQHIAITA